MRTRKTRYTYIEIKKIIESKNYILISDTYIKEISPLIIMDYLGYYYKTSFNAFKKNKRLMPFHKSNPYTIQNIKLWCQLNNKPFILVSEKYEGADKKLKWKCLKENCGEIFELSWGCAHYGIGCGACEGLQVGLSNCLATKNPELAKEWHPTLNGDLTPYYVTANSGKEVWWQCAVNSNHVWMSLISNRNSLGNSCPYCAGQLPSNEYNLLVCNPELCEEWNYEKNDKKPEEYTPNSNHYAMWKCKECGHEWEAAIFSRNGDNRCCPECNKSKGEKRIIKVLENNFFIIITQKEYNKLIYIDEISERYCIPQKEFNGLTGLGNKNLSYDFYLPQYNLLIEYQGEFHDGTASLQSKKDFKKQQEHDRRKCEYAKLNGYKLLEIWYWDFDNIEEILKRELNI